MLEASAGQRGLVEQFGIQFVGIDTDLALAGAQAEAADGLAQATGKKHPQGTVETRRESVVQLQPSLQFGARNRQDPAGFQRHHGGIRRTRIQERELAGDFAGKQPRQLTRRAVALADPRGQHTVEQEKDLFDRAAFVDQHLAGLEHPRPAGGAQPGDVSVRQLAEQEQHPSHATLPAPPRRSD